MKRLLLAAAALVCAVGIPMFAQGIRFDSRVLTSATNVAPGAQVPVLAIPNATVTVCATGQSPCSPAIPVYANQALTVQTQNPMKTDGQGRFGFWIASGTYFYTVQDVQGNILGTFPFSVGGAGAAGAVNSVFGRAGNVVAQTGDYTVSQVTNAADIASVTTAQATANAAVPKAGGTMTGLLLLSADPSVALGAATKQYVDNHAGGSSFITSLTTIGTSGPATVSSGVLNIPQYTSGGGGSMTWPAAAGIANYAGGNAWGTSYSASNQIPSTFIPTLNQSTTGNAATATAAVNLSGTQIGNAFYASPNGASGIGSWRRIVSGDIPTLPYIASSAAPTGAIVGTTDTQTLTNKTVDGVAPATMAFVDPTSSIQTQLNGKAPVGAANVTTTVGVITLAANSSSSSAITVSMPGVTTGMTFEFTATADATGITGWGNSGGLMIQAWPTANQLNYKVVNQTASSITTGASITFNVSAK